MSDEHVRMIKRESASEKQLSYGALTARLAVPILAWLHALENECGEAVSAGIATYGTPQNQQPQQTLTKTFTFGLMNITLVTTGTAGHLGASQKRLATSG